LVRKLSSGSVIDFPEKISLSGLEIKEVLFENSSCVTDWRLETLDGDEWTTVYTGKGIGPNFKATFKTVAADAVRINILNAVKGPTISEVKIIK
jgi:hypothetical protein